MGILDSSGRWQGDSQMAEKCRSIGAGAAIRNQCSWWLTCKLET